MEEAREQVEVVGKYAATLSVVEVALGSLLHAFHVPFTGNFLSLNQGFLLCRATLAGRLLPQPKFIAYSVSNVAAVLKSLAPAGKKLGPMLSLSMQGLFFSLGIWTFGGGLFGLAVAMALLSLWTFLQPLLTYYLFFGSQLFAAFLYLFQKTVPYTGIEFSTVIWIFVALVVGKMLAAVGLAVLAWRTQGQISFQDKLVDLALERGLKPLDGKPGAKRGSAFLLALRDLFRPIFLISLLVTGIFLYFAEHERARIGWLLMRPIAIGFVFFYFSRTLTLDRWLVRLEDGRFRGFALACQSALVRLRKLTG